MELRQQTFKKIFYRIRFSSCSGAWLDSYRTPYRCSDLSAPPECRHLSQNNCYSLFRRLYRSDLRIFRRYLLYLQRSDKSSYCCWFIIHKIQFTVKEQHTRILCRYAALRLFLYYASCFSNSFLTPWIATSTPRISSNTANISCNVFPRSRPVENSAFESFVIVIPSAVKVTAIMNTIGIQSMQPWRLVFFKNTAHATSVSFCDLSCSVHFSFLFI